MRDIVLFKAALQEILETKDLAWNDKIVIELPKDEKFGDLATNIAMILAKVCQKNPRELATEFCAELQKNSIFSRVEIAGPGFINVTFQNSFWQEQISYIKEQGKAFGSASLGNNRKVNVEFVSANPTGPLHIGHGRGAAVGDSVTRILRFAGFDVTPEYYINDAGRQMRLLGLSTWLRVKELCNIPFEFPEDYYKGEYIIDIAKQALEQYPDLPQMADPEDFCYEFAMNNIMAGIKQDLLDFGVEHKVWFSEASLVNDNTVERTLNKLLESGVAYHKDNALWFRTTDFGDDKDRVLRKSDGFLTYFASDIAYHANKIERGFDVIIDIVGADHHGYIPRIRAAIDNLGKNSKEDFAAILIQLVNLLRGGEPVAMSTRSGEFDTLREVIDEVGVDAARFMFLSRKSDQALDFDLELVKQRNLENPVYYVQYAHARIKTLLERAKNKGICVEQSSLAQDLTMLSSTEDLSLIRQVLHFEDAVLDAAKSKAVHIISFYLMNLAGKLHSYYANVPVLGGEESLIRARLAMLEAVAGVLANGLELLGVSAPDSM